MNPSLCATPAVSLSGLLRILTALTVLTAANAANEATPSIATNTARIDEAPAAITAASASQADVQSAIDAATAGDTVLIPAGTATWGTGGSSLSISKAITLSGAGQDITTIDIASTAGAWTSGTVSIFAAATIKSLTIRTPTSGGCGTAFSAGSTAGGFRITDVTYLGRTTSTNGYFVYSDAYGLIDSCSITGGAGDDELIFLRGPSDSWQTNHSMGGAANFFIEDCTFGGAGYVNDCNSNSRCVVRFNTVTGAMKVDGHGKYSNTPPRGVRHMEIYHNTWTGDGYWAAMELRGGTGRVFNNSTTGANGVWLMLHEYFVLNDAYTAANYPVIDQIGVGKDPRSAASEPMYLWGNRHAGAIWPISAYASMTGVINADRDYYNEVAGFSGASGVGSGTTAQMNALAPTRANVGFWATDQGSWNTNTPGTDGAFYVWNGSSWVLNYTPYTYPHPLRAATTDTTAPTISITAPASSATLSGTAVTISASATDDTAVVGVQFTVDGVNLGPEDTASPYSVSWNTTLATNGTHSLTATARDAAGNTATAAAINVTVSNASGAVIRRVGPGRTYARPSLAAAAAQSGDIIEIDAGTYSDDSTTWSASNLTIRGVGGLAHLRWTTGMIPNGKAIWVITGANTTVEGIEFSGARVTDENGAGIRQEGAGLTMRNCYLHDCENGILTNAGDYDILIEYSEFANNGFGTGYTHNMYIGNIRKFTLQHSTTHHAKVGHNVKSRARENHILYNRVMDEATGTASYAIDIPNGGTAYLIGNLIQQGPLTSNYSTIVSYAAEGGSNPDQHLYLINNTLVNDYPGGGTVRFVFAGSATTTLARNNLFVGSGTAYAGPGIVNLTTDNLVATTGLIDRANYDYRITSTSTALDRGSDPGSANGVNLLPVFHYVHPANREPRPISGALDFGAFERIADSGPTIATQPVSQTSVAGSAVTYSVAATAGTTLTYQWQKDGVAIAGATSSSYTLPSTQAFHAGSYRVVVTAGGVTMTSSAATLTVSAAPTSNARLLNLSTRALTLTGDTVLIPGFVLTGTGTKKMLIRGIGPTLGSFGVNGTLADPSMTLKSDSTTLAANDDWGTNANKAQIISTSAMLGAFALVDGSKDSALLVDLAPGAYTVPTAGNAGGTGVAMVELYDADAGTPTARLVNISNRGFVDVGDNIMIPGFVVSNEGSRTFLVRAVGPTLAAAPFNLTGTLADPVLTIFSGSTAILSNDDWGIGSSNTASVAATVGAFSLLAASKDAAFVVTLPPGPYTVQATGKAGTTGIALVEVYLVP